MIKNAIIKILGCGTSGGVPSITGYHGKCNIKNKKNQRTRTSAIVKYNNINILIDTSPDLRFQFLKNKINNIDYIFYTHEHHDHLLGINELHYMRFNRKTPIQIYCTQSVKDKINLYFDYLIKMNTIKINLIKDLYEIKFKDLQVNAFSQNHGKIDTMSYTFILKNKKFCYTTDVFSIQESKLKKLKNIDFWIVSCISIKDPIKNHAGLNKILKWQKIVNAKKIILTHMGENMDYDKITEFLNIYHKDQNIELAYDGMNIEV